MSRILIIEDEPDQIKMVKFRLEASGYQVLAANNAEEGIKLAQEMKPDLILMDMLLPGMPGLEATRKLKESLETKSIPIIAITAIGVPDIEEKCIQAGCSNFVRKPYESQELLQKIEENLRRG